MAARTESEQFLSDPLAPESDEDYGPNGVQVEGKPGERTLISGVGAGRAQIGLEHPA